MAGHIWYLVTQRNVHPIEYYFVTDHELIMSSLSILDDVEPNMDYGILVYLT